MTDTSAEAVERLIMRHTDACVMETSRVGRSFHGDTAATLRALLAERDAARAEAAKMREALLEARTTLSITRGNIAAEMKQGRDYQWDGVPEILHRRISDMDAALARDGGGA